MLLLTVIVLVCCSLGNAAIGDSDCKELDGTCQNWLYYKCTAGYETGLCSGDSNNRCCLPCDANCVLLENSYDDGECIAKGGVCQDNSNYCDSSYKSGSCGGPAYRQCCVASSSGCSLETYSTFYVRGYSGLSVEIDSGFRDSMNRINSYAQSCGVTVWVTHAFRYEGQVIGGAVVPPATTSNHLVGHAIDFNLETDYGWCNGDCLYAGNDADAECFIQLVLNDNSLRWGGIWIPSDPVHIDDGLNYNDPGTWDDLYYELQGNC